MKNSFVFHNRWGLLVLLFLTGLVLYNAVLSPPTNIYYTTDEIFSSDSGVLTLFGSPIRNADWPAMINVWIAYILYIFHWLALAIKQIINGTTINSLLSGFDTVAFDYFQNRESYILQHRVIQLFIIVLIYITIFRTFYFSKATYLSKSARHYISVFLLFFHNLWTSSGAIRPDAIAAALFLLIISKIFLAEFAKKQGILSLLVLFSLLLSQRLLYLIYAPVVLLSICYFIVKNKYGIRFFWQSILVFLISFVAFLPHIFTNTVMVLKCFLGGILVKSEGKNAYWLNDSVILEILSNPFNWIYIVLGLMGIYFIFRHFYSKFIGYILIGNYLLACILILQATTVTSSHTIVLASMSIPLAAMGLGQIYSNTPSFLGKFNQKHIVFTVFVIACIATVTQYVSTQHELKKPTNLQDTVKWFKNLPNDTKIMLSFDDFDYFVSKNDSCLIREINSINDENFQNNKLRTLFRWNENENIPLIARTSNFEDEKMILLENKLLLQYSDSTKTNKLDAYYFSRPNIVAFAESEEQAISDFKKGKFEFIVLPNNVLEGYPVFKAFNTHYTQHYYVFRNEKNNKAAPR